MTHQLEITFLKLFKFLLSIEKERARIGGEEGQRERGRLLSRLHAQCGAQHGSGLEVVSSSFMLGSVQGIKPT